MSPQTKQLDKQHNNASKLFGLVMPGVLANTEPLRVYDVNLVGNPLVSDDAQNGFLTSADLKQCHNLKQKRRYSQLRPENKQRRI